MTGESRTLAEAAAALSGDGLLEHVRVRAAAILLDTVAGAVGGRGNGMHRRLADLLEPAGGGRSTLLGRAETVSVGDAVAYNATLPTVLQLDEGVRRTKGHPGIHVVPVVLAVGEQRGSSWAEVLTALVAGYETAARIAIAMGGTKADIHPHGNWGSVGAAVSAALLYAGPDPDVLTHAIDIAAGVAGRFDRRAVNRGADTHHLWSSVGAHTGLMAGATAAAGGESVPDTLVDYLLPTSGARPRAELLGEGIDDGRFRSFVLAENYFKLWSACGHTHTAIGAALDVAGRGGFVADDIEAVEVRTFAAASLGAQRVRNALAARFSIPFVVAASFLDGEFTDDSLADPGLARLAPLAGRVRTVHDRELDAGYPEAGRPLHLTVRLRDGRALEADALLSDGDAERPVGTDVLRAKARRLLARSFGDAGTARVIEVFDALGPADPVTIFGEALRVAAREG